MSVMMGCDGADGGNGEATSGGIDTDRTGQTDRACALTAVLKTGSHHTCNLPQNENTLVNKYEARFIKKAHKLLD